MIDSISKIDWVDDVLSISGAIDSYSELSKQKIDIVVNLREETHDDIAELTKRGVLYAWIPVPDYFAPRKYQVEIFMNLIRNNPDKKILLHCALGMGRSAMLVVAYLIEMYNLDMDEAIAKLKEARSIINMSPPQLDKLKKIYCL